MQTQQQAGRASEGRGYLAAWAGAFCGGLVAFAAGAAVGFSVGTAAVRKGSVQGEGMMAGLGEALAPMGSALVYGLFAGFAGSVLGCWLVLHLLQRSQAARTARLFAAILPVSVLGLAWIGSALGAEWLSALVLTAPLAARAAALRGDHGPRPA